MEILSRKEFYNYISNDYKPSSFEDLSDDDRFPDGIYRCHISRTRYYYVYCQVASEIIKKNTKVKVLDIGFYPGTLIRILKELLGDNVECYGAGLMIDSDFKEYMDPYLERCVQTEMDPFYNKKGESLRLDFPDDTFDIVISTEVLEHCISPLELIAEGARVLKAKGSFIITTPNVSHIGAVVKLVFGRSNYERLKRSPMYLQDDEWRGHIRFYDKNELILLFKDNKLDMRSHNYYTECGWTHIKRNIPQKLLFAIRNMFFTIPVYREGHFAVFSKTCN